MAISFWQLLTFTSHHGEINNNRNWPSVECRSWPDTRCCQVALQYLCMNTSLGHKWHGNGWTLCTDIYIHTTSVGEALTKCSSVSTTSLFDTCFSLIKPTSNPNFNSSLPSDLSTSWTVFISLPLSSATIAMAEPWDGLRAMCQIYNTPTTCRSEGDTSDRNTKGCAGTPTEGRQLPYCRAEYLQWKC